MGGGGGQGEDRRGRDVACESREVGLPGKAKGIQWRCRCCGAPKMAGGSGACCGGPADE